MPKMSQIEFEKEILKQSVTVDISPYEEIPRYALALQSHLDAQTYQSLSRSLKVVPGHLLIPYLEEYVSDQAVASEIAQVCLNGKWVTLSSQETADRVIKAFEIQKEWDDFVYEDVKSFVERIPKIPEIDPYPDYFVKYLDNLASAFRCYSKPYFLISLEKGAHKIPSRYSIENFEFQYTTTEKVSTQLPGCFDLSSFAPDAEICVVTRHTS